MIDVAKWLEENSGLVGTAVRKYSIVSPRISEEDLRQEAHIAVFKAAQTFDENHIGENGLPTKFSSFAYRAMYYSLRDFVRRNKHDLKVTAYKDGQDYKKSLLERETEGEPDDSWAAPTEFVPQTIALRLNMTGTTSREGDELGDMIASGVPPPIDALIHEEETECVRAALNKLPEREREVLYSIYFKDQSVAEIAHSTGFSRQWVHQIQKKALGQLKSKLGSSID